MVENKIKKFFLSGLLLLLAVFLSAENQNGGWQLQENQNEKYLYYTILAAPVEYENLIGSNVYVNLSNAAYRNLYNEPCEEKLLDFLVCGKFEVRALEGHDCAFVDSSFIDLKECKLSKKQLDYIWKTMSLHYAGFSAMKKRGFTKIASLACNNGMDLKKLFDKYIDDCHFCLMAGDFFYRKDSARDEGTKKSIDPDGTYFEKDTSNAYYIRFNNCTGLDYTTSLGAAAFFALNKDFIILDARSNYGGNDMPQFSFLKVLNTHKYTGTLIALQDNWSYSSGEVWHVIGRTKNNFECKLVGTHSGGLQNYGNCKTYENKELGISLYFGKTDFTKDLPVNYLGDGKGYEPDVWATTQTMKSVLEEMGVDTGDIVFQ